MLSLAHAQETTPMPENLPSLIPPNRKQPTFNPELDMVQGALEPVSNTPVFKPKPIPPNRMRPVISKADVVMAATDKVGILVNNLAQDLAVDLNKLLQNLSEISQKEDEDSEIENGWADNGQVSQ